MGKVRRLRKKFHLACQKLQTGQDEAATITAGTPVPVPVVPVLRSIPGRAEVPVKLGSDSNIFAGITISVSDLQQTLLPPPTQVQVLGSATEAPVAESDRTNPSSAKHVSKKEKRLARREALLRKIDTVRQLKQEATKKKKVIKKKEAAKPMQMNSLIDALPLITINKDSKSQSDPSKKTHKKSYLGKKKRNGQFMDNLKAFKTVLSNDHYQANPASAISNYLIRSVSVKSAVSKKNMEKSILGKYQAKKKK